MADLRGPPPVANNVRGAPHWPRALARSGRRHRAVGGARGGPTLASIASSRVRPRPSARLDDLQLAGAVVAVDRRQPGAVPASSRTTRRPSTCWPTSTTARPSTPAAPMPSPAGSSWSTCASPPVTCFALDDLTATVDGHLGAGHRRARRGRDPHRADVTRPPGGHRHGQARRRRAQLRQRHRRDVRRRGRPRSAGAMGPPHDGGGPRRASASTPTCGPRAATGRSCARSRRTTRTGSGGPSRGSSRRS